MGVTENRFQLRITKHRPIVKHWTNLKPESDIKTLLVIDVVSYRRAYVRIDTVFPKPTGPKGVDSLQNVSY